MWRQVLDAAGWGVVTAWCIMVILAMAGNRYVVDIRDFVPLDELVGIMLTDSPLNLGDSGRIYVSVASGLEKDAFEGMDLWAVFWLADRMKAATLSA
ncbi:MAG: hypothetical protein FWE20_00915 [Defluviitaleaceae bacterium]|nr:hypothetical protein [Defluviitaleaceae bacterium]